MVLAEVKAVYDRVVKEKIEGQKGMAKNCQYYVGGHGNEFCKATTQTTCRLCRSYEPNMQERGSLLAGYILELEKKNKELTEETGQLREKVNGMTDQIEEFKVFAKLVELEVRGEDEEEKEEEDVQGDN